jgi:hypothetical protein
LFQRECSLPAGYLLPLLHGMLRAKTNTAEEAAFETAGATEVMRWMTERKGQLVTVSDEVEKALIAHVIDHYRIFKQPPSRQTLDDMIRRDAKFPDPEINRRPLRPACSDLSPNRCHRDGQRLSDPQDGLARVEAARCNHGG